MMVVLSPDWACIGSWQFKGANNLWPGEMGDDILNKRDLHVPGYMQDALFLEILILMEGRLGVCAILGAHLL